MLWFVWQSVGGLSDLFGGLYGSLCIKGLFCGLCGSLWAVCVICLVVCMAVCVEDYFVVCVAVCGRFEWFVWRFEWFVW